MNARKMEYLKPVVMDSPKLRSPSFSSRTYLHRKMVKFEDLKGEVLDYVAIHKDLNADNSVIIFSSKEGRLWIMTHTQDCCENVDIEEVVGSFDDLLDSPIVMAEEITSNYRVYGNETATWTFYKLATVKGYVTLRWYGASNGYYSESVDFYEIIDKEN